MGESKFVARPIDDKSLLNWGFDRATWLDQLRPGNELRCFISSQHYARLRIQMTYQRLEFSSFRVGVRAEQKASTCESNDAECSLAPSAAVIATHLDVAKYSGGGVSDS